MGNTNKKLEPCMKVDRIIASEPYPSYVGVNWETGDKSNPYKNQVIRVGEDGLKSMVSYMETTNGIEYHFEDNVCLRLMKKEDDVVYHIQTKQIDYTSKVDPFIKKNWKNVSFSSYELDKIDEWMK
jgi:hypothetical protein